MHHNTRQTLDYTAFNAHQKAHQPAGPLTVLVITTIVVAALFAILAGVWLLAIPADVVFALFGLFCVALLIGGPFWLYVRLFRRRHNAFKKLFSSFAATNGFTYVGRQSLDIKLLDMGSDVRKVADYGFSGSYGQRRFTICIVSAFTSYYRTVPTHYGVVTVQLGRAYPPVIAERKPRAVRPWVKNGMQPAGNLNGYRLYQTQDGLNTLPSNRLARFLQKAAAAQADIEIAGNKLYIVQTNGLQMTLQGMESLFQLMQDVDLFD